LLGRGRTHLRHPGNERMRSAADMHSMRYNATTLRKEKTAITQQIVEIIQSSGDPPGRFLEFDREVDGWVKVGDEVARRKVSHAIRYDSRYKKRKAPPETFEASVQQAHIAAMLYVEARPAAATTKNDRVIEPPWFPMRTFSPGWGTIGTRLTITTMLQFRET
jgi:hypothetical protein